MPGQPQTYRVTLSDGRAFDVTTEGGPPSEEDVYASLGDSSQPEAPEPAAWERALEAMPRGGKTAAALVGFGKEAATRVVDLGRIVGDVTGLDRLVGDIPKDAPKTLGLRPSTPAQEIGATVERAAEFMVPAGAADRAAISVGSQLAQRFPGLVARFAPRAARVGAQAGLGAAESAASGGDATTGAMIAAAVPVAGGAVAQTARTMKGASTALVRTAIKPTVTTLKKMVGSNRNLDAQAEKIAQFIVRRRLMNADQARQLFNSAETELQSVIGASNAPTDAAVRAERYLQALERSAAKQGLAADDVAAIRNAGAELVKGPMGEDVVTMTLKPHPTLLDASGKPIQVFTPVVTRQLRRDVTAREALESARSSGRWGTRKAWGEQTGVSKETKKAVERAQRDAVKVAVPEAKALLAEEGQALTAADVLDRMAQRQGNREAIGLPEKIAGAIELSQGKLPVMALAGNWLRNNGLKAGIWADKMADAIQQNDIKTATEILARFGVGMELQRQ